MAHAFMVFRLASRILQLRACILNYHVALNFAGMVLIAFKAARVSSTYQDAAPSRFTNVKSESDALFTLVKGEVTAS